MLQQRCAATHVQFACKLCDVRSRVGGGAALPGAVALLRTNAHPFATPPQVSQALVLGLIHVNAWHRRILFLCCILAAGVPPCVQILISTNCLAASAPASPSPLPAYGR